jgi:hypothetical protein
MSSVKNALDKIHGSWQMKYVYSELRIFSPYHMIILG